MSVHAEKLHDDRVWHVVERFARVSATRGQKLTFFVHPFWSIVAGYDISKRIQRLACLGHEIGQHTHYYDVATARTPGRKAGDLSPENVLRRLEEDHTQLLRSGIRPKGFVSGAWVVPDALHPWLASRGFAYDCTYRTYAMQSRNGPAMPGGTTGPFLLDGGVLELPTTASLRAAAVGLVRARPPVAHIGDLEYELVYLHDDDLVDRRKRAALGAVVIGVRWRRQIVTSGELAERAKLLVNRSAQ